MTDTDIQNTIQELGADNALNVSLKLNDLIRLIETAKRDAWCIRTPNTGYAVGNQVNIPGVENYGYMLRCKTAGMTGAAPIDFSNISVGQQITDGFVTWEVIERVSFPDIPGAPVATVNGKTGDVTISIDDIDGLRDAVNAIDDKLPLYGGTLTGSLYFSRSGNIKSAPTDYIMIMSGEEYLDSPHILLRGANATPSENEVPGEIFIIANDGKNVSRLVCRPNGEFTWQGKNIVRSINNIPADMYGNVPFDVPVKSVNGKTGEVTINVPDSPGYPDYENAKPAIKAASYKAEADGWVYAEAWSDDTYRLFYVNGKKVAYGNGSDLQGASCFVPVKAGDVVTVTNAGQHGTAGGSVDATFIFYPKR